MARKYSSDKINAILNRITPLTKMEVSSKMDLAARIDDLIKEKGWSKIQFAEKVNKNPSEVSRWLGGGHNFTIDTLCEIAVAFGLELKDLFEHFPNNANVMHAEAAITSQPSPYKICGFNEALGVAEPAASYQLTNIHSNNHINIPDMSNIDQKVIKTEIQLIGIDIIEITLKLPDVNVEPVTAYNFNAGIETRLNPTQNAIIVLISIQINSEDLKTNFAYIKTGCQYKISNFHELINSTPNVAPLIPPPLLDVLNSISLSTTRGIMYSQFKGTFLHNAMLPIFDPKAFKQEGSA